MLFILCGICLLTEKQRKTFAKFLTFSVTLNRITNLQHFLASSIIIADQRILVHWFTNENASVTISRPLKSAFNCWSTPAPNCKSFLLKYLEISAFTTYEIVILRFPFLFLKNSGSLQYPSHVSEYLQPSGFILPAHWHGSPFNNSHIPFCLVLRRIAWQEWFFS